MIGVSESPSRCASLNPNKDPTAQRFSALTHEQAVAARVKVMDESAFVLASEQRLPMHIFDVSAPGAMRRICEGEDIGTLIATSTKPPAES